jgi:Cys-rich protein (TIGR01571 family)
MVNWEENLFGCCAAGGFCCLVMVFPCCYPVFQGFIVNKATGESCFAPCCCSLMLCCVGGAMNRGKIRDRYLIQGSFCSDCLVHCLCTPCAICQEYSEVRNREGR